MLLLIGRRFDPPHPGGGGAASHMSMESKTVFRPLKEARESGSRCQHIPIKVDISGGHALDGRDQGRTGSQKSLSLVYLLYKVTLKSTFEKMCTLVPREFALTARSSTLDCRQ